MKINKQKREEQKLKKDFQLVYGGDDVALEKQQKLNSITDEIRILEKQHERAKAEELDIELYQQKMGGLDSETQAQIAQAKKEIEMNKQEYKEML